jgi:hypothetical protein
MLGEIDWLVPIAQAQRQYQSTYEGMTAASLLEDLWFDAVSNFAGRHAPDVQLEKSPRSKPSDYVVNGLALSHKNVQGKTSVGVHWDATVAVANTTWTAAMPMVILSSAHTAVRGHFVLSDEVLAARAGYPAPATIRGRLRYTVVEWTPAGTATTHDSWPALPSWQDLWPVFAKRIDQGAPANTLDLVLLPDHVTATTTGELRCGERPGVYLLPLDLLNGVPVKPNNRGTTITGSVLEDLMQQTRSLGLFTPMPMWPAHYASPRPPDLFLAQKGEFDRVFSPAFNLPSPGTEVAD